MELAQIYPDPYDKASVVTICDANIATYLSGRHSVLHVCFLKDLSRVPIMGLASYRYKDVWRINVAELDKYYAPFNFGRKRIPKCLEQEEVRRGDTVQVEFKFRGNQLYARIGKNRSDWTRWLCTNFDPSIMLTFIVETAKENITVLRDDLYLDYLMNGSPRTLRHCSTCDEERDRVVVSQCGHYMCIDCWNSWFKEKLEMYCVICNERIERQTIAKLRDSPCPIDYCRFKDTERDYILVPCGCVVHCVNDSQGSGVRCPYEACNKLVDDKWVLYH